MSRSSLRLRVVHTTRYAYDDAVSESHNEVRLQPLSDEFQTCLDFRLLLEPAVALHSFEQPGGRLHYFGVRPLHRELALRSESVVLVHQREKWTDVSGEALGLDGGWERKQKREWAEFLSETSSVPFLPEALELARDAGRRSGGKPLGFLLDLTRRIHRTIRYKSGVTDIDTPLSEVFARKEGVCQDMAHLMLSILRQVGVPCRYVSGYLYTGKDKGESRLVGGDAMHAWVEALLPDGEWYGFDPTNDKVADHFYIRVHTGRDYRDVIPVKGIYRGSALGKMTVDVAVARLG